ncbi:MAG: YjjW family glycine radical enzyme activase, partial [Spirochaetes bacterium]|nr:YjjW family glycine radical enzyme activase [Spirochaetota bacterium]
CNFNCNYCHNPETIRLCIHCGKCAVNCPVHALTLKNGKIAWNQEKCIDCDQCLKICPYLSSPKTKEFTVKQILNEIEKVRSFISGVTISGGEPLMQFSFLKKLSLELDKKAISLFIDTNGSIPLWKEAEFVQQVNRFMIDFKAWDEKEYQILCDFPRANLLKNLEYLVPLNKVYEVRTVIYPAGFNPKGTVKNIAQFLKQLNAQITYKLIPFRPQGVRAEYLNDEIPDENLLNQLKELALKEGLKNVIIHDL